MNRSKIEWCDHSINPVKGLCPVGCSYCYARAMYHRFKWDPEIRYDADWMMPLYKLKQPSRVFVGSTMELFGPWIEERWLRNILAVPKSFPQHTFIFLTKRPANLPKSKFGLKWPDNCWVGVTATNWMQFSNAIGYLATVKAPIQFLSIEPLLERIKPNMMQMMMLPHVVQWLIIGQQTPVRKSTMPKVEWVSEIVSAADRASVPVFLKDNLDCLIGQDQRFKRLRGYDDEGHMLVGLRQEFPNRGGCLP